MGRGFSMNEKKYFSTPDQVHLELPTNLTQAISYVELQLKSHNFKFNPPYSVKRFGGELIQLLRDSGWDLKIIQDQDWEIRPII
mgnify:CR=1 FL=1